MRRVRGPLVWAALLLAGCGTRVCVRLAGGAFGARGKISICSEPRAVEDEPRAARVVVAVPIDAGAGDGAAGDGAP